MYQREAQGLASLGRGPDTELVHMTQGEVGALDNLARRTGFEGLPVNPQTGLPEAGIFSNILPMLVGAGAAIAAPFTAGTSLAALGPLLSSPLAMGGISALGAGIASGFDAAEMAKWGLGVGSGSQIAGSLAGAGAATPAGQAATTTAIGGTGGRTIGAEGSRMATIDTINNPARALAGASGSTQGTLNAGNMLRGFSGAGLKNLAGLGAKGTALGTLPLYTGAGSLMASQYTKEPEPFEPVVKDRDIFYPEGGFMPPPRTSVNPFAGELTPTDTGEAVYFDPEVYTSPGYIPAREGGLMGLKQYEEGGKVSAPSISVPTPDAGEASYFSPNRATTSFAGPNIPTQYAYALAPQLKAMHEGTLRFNNGQMSFPGMNNPATIRTPKDVSSSGFFGFGNEIAEGIAGANPDTQEMLYYNQGGLTRGPGDGMSDNIMLPIKGSRDIAAVSPDEFVVPADVVSGLGNGSTSAGAKQLYGMMDRVRDTRTGKTAQPRAINAGKMMPV